MTQILGFLICRKFIRMLRDSLTRQYDIAIQTISTTSDVMP
jgi:hypothetical protein